MINITTLKKKYPYREMTKFWPYFFNAVFLPLAIDFSGKVRGDEKYILNRTHTPLQKKRNIDMNF